MNKIILEISVDRNNDKGVYIAEQVLNIFHNTLEVEKKFFKKRVVASPEFSFEIVNNKGSLSFYFIIEEHLRDVFENQIYAHYPNVEIREVRDFLSNTGKIHYGNLKFLKDYIYPIKTYADFKEDIDPFSSITSALNKANTKNTSFIQVNFSPIPDFNWKNENVISILTSKYPKFFKKFLIGKEYKYLKYSLFPITLLFKFLSLIASPSNKSDAAKKELDPIIVKKLTGFGFSCSVNIAVESDNETVAKVGIKEMVTALNFFSIAGQNSLILDKIQIDDGFLSKRKNEKKLILNGGELAGIVHLPTLYVQTPGINWITTKVLEPPQNIPIIDNNINVSPIGKTNFRGVSKKFGILPVDRTRHVYIIGKTGMGKSVLLENMIYEDICKGRGVALIDPHGDLADTLVSNIPKNRTNDVILFDPSDYKYPIAFNMFENVSKEHRPLVMSGLVGIFKRMWADSWGPRLEYILRNCILTLLEIPDATLMSIPLILTNKSYRLKVVSKIEDVTMKRFWEQEFEVMEPKQMTEAISPILNKVGQFLSNPLLRNILAQPKNAFSLRWIMDNNKILIINLSKGKIGDDSMALLGSMMVTKFQIDAMSRADIAEDKRKDFYFYVDEFQNFATDSFAVILAEARKYKLNLIVANQYISQMSETVRNAVFGNVGTILSFQVGPDDAPKLAQAIGDDGTVSASDLLNLRKYDIYSKLLIEGMPSRVFSATTLPPVKTDFDEQRKNVVAKVSREKYGKPIDFVEKKIMDFNVKIVADEKKFKKEEAEYKEKMKEEKAKKKNEEFIKKKEEEGKIK
ncbi:MAG: type IV secretion system DNA-binding domain-containing protein [Candidatus Gracilibacteria bacterium]|nr:type IV secretion system DNA-binding domain-containing protein [Candidatus Gracilibacteria bacterium]